MRMNPSYQITFTYDTPYASESTENLNFSSREKGDIAYAQLERWLQTERAVGDYHLAYKISPNMRITKIVYEKVERISMSTT